MVLLFGVLIVLMKLRVLLGFGKQVLENDGAYTQIITQKDDYWTIFDYNTKTHLDITGCDGFVQIFDYKQNQYSLYNYETVKERKDKLNRNNYDN